jgi:hypothetical protein
MQIGAERSDARRREITLDSIQASDSGAGFKGCPEACRARIRKPNKPRQRHISLCSWH